MTLRTFVPFARLTLGLAALLAAAVLVEPLLATVTVTTSDTPPANRPLLSAVHPLNLAAFQALVSLTALVAFPARRPQLAGQHKRR